MTTPIPMAAAPTPAEVRATLLAAMKAKVHKYLEKDTLRSAWSAARDEIMAHSELHDLMDAVSGSVVALVKANDKAGFTAWLDGLA